MIQLIKNMLGVEFCGVIFRKRTTVRDSHIFDKEE